MADNSSSVYIPRDEQDGKGVVYTPKGLIVVGPPVRRMVFQIPQGQQRDLALESRLHQLGFDIEDGKAIIVVAVADEEGNEDYDEISDVLRDALDAAGGALAYDSENAEDWVSQVMQDDYPDADEGEPRFVSRTAGGTVVVCTEYDKAVVLEQGDNVSIVVEFDDEEYDSELGDALRDLGFTINRRDMLAMRVVAQGEDKAVVLEDALRAVVDRDSAYDIDNDVNPDCPGWCSGAASAALEDKEE